MQSTQNTEMALNWQVEAPGVETVGSSSLDSTEELYYVFYTGEIELYNMRVVTRGQ